MSKASVVSVANYAIGPEDKPGLFPGSFIVPPANGHPGVLHLDNGMQHIPQLNYQVIQVGVDAEEIARSIVDDYRNAQIVSEPGAKPGVFYLLGHVKPENVIERCADLLIEELDTWNGKGERPYNKYQRAVEEHTEWCRKLVTRADDAWSEKKMRRMISTTMIMAGRFLGLEREWMNIDFARQAEKCPVCKTLLESNSVICPKCSVILNKEAYQSFEFAGR